MQMPPVIIVATVNATATTTTTTTIAINKPSPYSHRRHRYFHRHRRGAPCPSLPTYRRSDECEKSFGSCLKKHCKAKYPGNEECTSTANTYVMGVTVSSGTVWAKFGLVCVCLGQDVV